MRRDYYLLEELFFSGISVAVRHHIPEDRTVHKHSCENLIFYIAFLFILFHKF
jgi:hypothetical protein